MSYFLQGALEEVVANPQLSSCVACSVKDQHSHIEFRIARMAREQMPVHCVADKGPEVSLASYNGEQGLADTMVTALAKGQRVKGTSQWRPAKTHLPLGT